MATTGALASGAGELGLLGEAETAAYGEVAGDGEGVASAQDSATISNSITIAVSDNQASLAAGTSVYRVWGGAATQWGRSWTRIDPSTIDNYRDLAGLPDANSGGFLSQGVLTDVTNIKQMSAEALDGNGGGFTLEKIENHLMLEGQTELAEQVNREKKFYGRTASEFLGESGLALKNILHSRDKLSSATLTLANNTYQKIVQVFDKL